MRTNGFVLATTPLVIFLVTGCAIGSSALSVSPTIAFATRPAVTGTVAQILSPRTDGPTSAVTLIPQQALTSTSQRTPTPVVHLTDTIRALFDASPKSDGREVEVIGYFRGWDLLGEVKGGSPVTRSDWVIADQSGAIYVTGLMPQ